MNPVLTFTTFSDDDWRAYYHDRCAKLSDIYNSGDYVTIAE